MTAAGVDREVAVERDHAVVIEKRCDALGIVHGGIAAAGLELAASEVVNGEGPPMRTASLRVNFMRPFHAGDSARYDATEVRVGRRSSIADARATNVDGAVAIAARLTAYR